MKQVKIALLTELFYPHMAGCERRFLEIGKRLAKRGHEVHVFTLQHDANLPKEEIVEGIFVHRCAYSGKYITPNGLRSFGGVLKYSLATSARLFGKDFDVYYSNQWPIVHSFFAKPFASPLVQEWCEVWAHSPKIMLLQRILKVTGDHHVAVSEFTRQRLIGLLNVQPEKLSVVPNGVDYAKFSNGLEERRWGRIVYVGRLTPHKRIDLLLDAFRQINEKIPEAELHIVGMGNAFPSLKEKASDLNNCFLHGFLTDEQMINILKSSWVFVLPSEREGSGISCLEAMATGLPLITVDHPDNAAAELAAHGRGLVAQPTSKAIADAMLELVANENLWKNMSRNCRLFAAEHDWDKMTCTMEEVLTEILEGY